MVEGFFTDEIFYTSEELLPKRLKDKPDVARDALAAAKDRCATLERWEHEPLEEAMRSLADDLGVKAGDLFMVLRVACMGKAISPPLFESMEILGKKRCLDRIAAGLALLTS